MNKFMLVLFNLKPGRTPEAFRAWMAEHDHPVVSKLPSIDEYNLCRTVGMLGPDGKPPYSHMEIIRVNDFDQLGRDAQLEAVQKAGGQMVADWAENPVFLLVEQIL